MMDDESAFVAPYQALMKEDAEVAQAVQEVTQNSLELVFVDQG